MIGITTSGLKVERDRLFAELTNSGISLIDCSITGLLKCDWKEVTEERVKQLANELLAAKIEVSSIQSIFYGRNWSLTKASDREHVMKHMQDLMKYCDILCTDRLLLGSPHQRQMLENNFDTIIAIDRLAENCGVRISVENLEMKQDMFGESVNDIQEFIRKMHLRSFGINFHLFLDEKPPHEELQFHAIHISDRNYGTNPLDCMTRESLRFIQNCVKNKPVILECNTDNLKNVMLSVDKLCKLL